MRQQPRRVSRAIHPAPGESTEESLLLSNTPTVDQAQGGHQGLHLQNRRVGERIQGPASSDISESKWQSRDVLDKIILLKAANTLASRLFRFNMSHLIPKPQVLEPLLCARHLCARAQADVWRDPAQ